jgi:hypothetical protein
MSYNGSGTFLINTAGQPVVSGTTVSSTAFNALTADLATGLSTAITKDGQTTVTANIPMSTYKFTGLGAGSAATDSANLSQVQSTVTKLLTSVSGTDTITAVGAPVVAAYAAGQMFYFVAAGDNTGAVTLNIDSLGAKAVTRDGSVALAAGDIKSGEVVVVVYDGTRFQVVSQLNSAGDARFANVSIASSLYVGGVATIVGNAGFSANVSITSALSVGGAATITGATTVGGALTLSGGTANGVLYLNGSKAATSGSALTFNGTNLINTAGYVSAATNFRLSNASFYRVADQSPGGFVGGYNIKSDGSTGAQHDSTGSVAGFGVYLDALTWYAGGSAAANTVAPERMRLTSAGNLGIGTSSPAQRLEVFGASNGAANTYIRVTANIASGYETGLQFFRNGGSIVNAQIAATTEVGNDFGRLTFSTANAGTLTERMRLDSSGNLGIGTTSPGSRLEVNGTSNLGGTAAAARVGLGVFSAGVASISTSGANDLHVGTTNASAAFRVYTNNSERLQVTGDGNYSIGNAQFGGGVRVVGIINATTVPTTNPTGGGILYVEAGALKYRGSSGTVTTIANA